MTFIASFYLLAASLTPQEAMSIGVRVWQNECGGTLDGLTSWNEQEEFASLGIGHFIWYPHNKRGPFAETFPELLQFLQEQKTEMPRWLEEARGCPWKTREQFLSALRQQSKQMMELRKLLKNTVGLQAQFLEKRLDQALPALIKNAPEEKKELIQNRFERIRNHPNGTFALLDYVNFKGYGTAASERYDGWGWGLYQVLDEMPDEPSSDPLEEFVATARAILERRVKNAPLIRNEQRYLQGWIFRLDTYLQKYY